MADKDEKAAKHPMQEYVAPNRKGLTDEEVTRLGVAAIDYDPKFDRMGVTRRVLGHITDEDHVGRGPRNEAARLAVELSEDPNTPGAFDVEAIQEHLDKLEEAGLVKQRATGAYSVTRAGTVELVN